MVAAGTVASGLVYGATRDVTLICTKEYQDNLYAIYTEVPVPATATTTETKRKVAAGEPIGTFSKRICHDPSTGKEYEYDISNSEYHDPRPMPTSTSRTRTSL